MERDEIVIYRDRFTKRLEMNVGFKSKVSINDVIFKFRVRVRFMEGIVINIGFISKVIYIYICIYIYIYIL